MSLPNRIFVADIYKLKNSAQEKKRTYIGFRESAVLVSVRPVGLPQHRRILGETVRVYRKQALMSQERLAEKSELSPKYLGEVERGCVNISVDALSRIAKALRIQVADLTRGF